MLNRREFAVGVSALTLFIIILYMRGHTDCHVKVVNSDNQHVQDTEDIVAEEKHSNSRNQAHESANVYRRCSYDTGTLIQSMRNAQRRLNRGWREATQTPHERWMTMPDIFSPMTSGFKLILRPFKVYGGDENKYFLPFKRPRSPCRHFAAGVGGTWAAEEALQQLYPQCSLIGVDPDKDNRRLVEALPQSLFVHAALHAEGGLQTASVRGSHGYARQAVMHKPFYKILIQHGGGHIIDFMTIDVEGGEYTLLRTLHEQRHLFAAICQFNVELHWSDDGYYNVSVDEFDKLFGDFLDVAHFVLFNIDYRGDKLRRLAFLNVGDEACIQKFLC